MTETRVFEYTAVIVADGPGFSVYFPDLPGCFSQGDTLEEARTNAHDALETHLEGLQLTGKPIPEPSAHIESVRVKAS